MGYDTEEIASLLATSRQPVPISGVCAVFAESEVINHLSQGAPPADIMQGAVESLVSRAVQLLKRVRAEPEFTLVGGILRFPTMARAVGDRLGEPVNLPAGDDGDAMQFIAALGAAILGQRRVARLGREKPVDEDRAIDEELGPDVSPQPPPREHFDPDCGPCNGTARRDYLPINTRRPASD